MYCSLFMDTQLGMGECDLFCWMELFFMHTQTHTHTHTHTHTNKQTNKQKHTHTLSHIHTNKHTHKFIHTHTHTHCSGLHREDTAGLATLTNTTQNAVF